jgi:hypothetical protein
MHRRCSSSPSICSGTRVLVAKVVCASHHIRTRAGAVKDADRSHPIGNPRRASDRRQRYGRSLSTRALRPGFELTARSSALLELEVGAALAHHSLASSRELPPRAHRAPKEALQKSPDSSVGKGDSRRDGDRGHREPRARDPRRTLIRPLATMRPRGHGPRRAFWCGASVPHNDFASCAAITSVMATRSASARPTAAGPA